MKVVMIVLMFFVFGALLVIGNNDLVLSDYKDSENFSKLYITWLDNVFENVKGVTGNVIKLDWLPS